MDTHTKRHEARRAVRQRCPHLRHFDRDLDEDGQELEEDEEEEGEEDGQERAPAQGSIPVSVASTWALCDDHLSSATRCLAKVSLPPTGLSGQCS